MSKPIVDGKCPPAKAQGSAKQRSRLTRIDTKSSRRDLLQKAASLITAFPTLSVVGTNLFAPQVALAANAREGADYKVLQAQAPQESADRIDVLGFFGLAVRTATPWSLR